MDGIACACVCVGFVEEGKQKGSLNPEKECNGSKGSSRASSKGGEKSGTGRWKDEGRGWRDWLRVRRPLYPDAQRKPNKHVFPNANIFHFDIVWTPRAFRASKASCSIKIPNYGSNLLAQNRVNADVNRE